MATRADRKSRAIVTALLAVFACVWQPSPPSHARDAATEAITDVSKTLKGTIDSIDSTARAVDKAVTSTLSGKPATAKKRKKSKPDQQTPDQQAKDENAKTSEGKSTGAPNTAVRSEKKDSGDGKAGTGNSSQKSTQAASEATSTKTQPAIVDANPVSGKAEDTAIKTPATAGPVKSFPRTLEEAKAEDAAAAKPPETWSETEIADGRARCAEILKRIHAVAIPESPIREGACGTPAPIQLISIGKSPEVSISPPATLTCEMAEKLAAWLEGDLQPLAKKHLGTSVIKIETMSSYSCRNAYGRTRNKLSEHGIANALDIRGFVTASAKSAMVLEDWGTTQREILARIAAEKAKAERLAAEKATAEKAAQASNRNGTAAPDGAAQDATGAARNAGTLLTDSGAKAVSAVPGAKGAASGFSFSDPSHLGGPRLAAASMTAASTTKAIVDIEIALPGVKAPAPGTRAFLHEAHAAACRIFGTTLGPEANDAHRNHFHVDMAKRKSAITKICD